MSQYDVRLRDPTVLAGDVVSGALAVTEAVDSLAASGTVQSAVATGDLAATEAADVAALAGTVLVAGTLATTEAADVAALVGDVVVAGSLAATEGTDTAAAAGDVVVAGALAVTEAPDVVAVAGTVEAASTTGDLATVEAADAFAAAGAVLVDGALAATEAADGLAASGVVLVAGAVVALEAQDAAAAQGAVVVAGAMAATEAADTFAAGATPPLEDSPAGGFYYIRRPTPVYGTAFLVAPAAEFSGVGRVIPQVRGTGRLIGYPATVRAQGEQDFTAIEDEELEWIERAGGLEDQPRERCHVCEAARLGKPGEGSGPREPRPAWDGEGPGGPGAGEEGHPHGRDRAQGAAGASRRRAGSSRAALAESGRLQPGLARQGVEGGLGSVPGGHRQGLTVRQAELFRLIQSVYETTGEPPSVLYLARRLHLHHSTVQAHLRVMCERGWLRAPTPEGLPQHPPQ